ncbi:MAG: YraN family protein [Methyloligellaceae bacterium]
MRKSAGKRQRSVSNRRRRYATGRHAERTAAFYLTIKGYRILQRNFRSPVGEIDIIAVRLRRLVFVEVKSRDRVSEALDAITSRQQVRIKNAAKFWLSRRPAYSDYTMSFDAIIVAKSRLPIHFANIF